jgi:hypothetical protein
VQEEGGGIYNFSASPGLQNMYVRSPLNWPPLSSPGLGRTPYVVQEGRLSLELFDLSDGELGPLMVEEGCGLPGMFFLGGETLLLHVRVPLSCWESVVESWYKNLGKDVWV